jgi:hypothetical protein
MLNDLANIAIFFCATATGLLMYSRVAPEHFEQNARPIFEQSWNRIEEYRTNLRD